MMAKGEYFTFLLQCVCLAFFSWYAASFIYVAAHTLTYPFHLEWMEGHMIDTIQRIMNGDGIYVEPSIEFIPFIYTPFYYYAAAFISLFTGVDFFPARLLSTAATLGSCVVLYHWVRKENGQWWHGLVAAGLYLATYKLSARWFDTSRIDSTFLFLTLAGLFVFFHYQSKRTAIIAGVILALAFFTKQSALIAAGPVLAAYWFIDRRRALTTGIVMGGIILVACYLFDSFTDGWFRFYVFELPAAHDIDRRFITAFWTREMLRPLPISFALMVLLFIRLGFKDWKKLLAYAALFVSLVVGSYIMRLHYGSYLNVLMPAHACMALFAALCLPMITGKLRYTFIIPVAIIVQMGMLYYNPLPFVPTKRSEILGNRFLKEIEKIEGDIFMPELQWVQTRAGKKSYAFGMAAYDLFRAKLGPKAYLKRKVGNQLQEAINQQQFAAIMPGRLFPLREKDGKYVFSHNIPYPREYVTGLVHFVISDIYVRKDLPEPVKTGEE